MQLIRTMGISAVRYVGENFHLNVSRPEGCPQCGVQDLCEALGKICWRALRTNAGVVNTDIIQKSTLLAGCSRRIEAEIEHGEDKWRTLLSESPELAYADCQLEDSEQIAVSKKPKPGRSNPRRDRVGGDRTPEETK